MKIKFKKLNPNAVLPSYKHEGDSGMDVSSVEDAVIQPHSFVKVGCGLAAEIPDGYEIQVRPRSGLQCKFGIVGAWGTVDAGYKGEIGIALYNHNDEPYYVRAGDRVAQFVVAPVLRVEIEETETLSESDRGASGFGSTGIQ